MGDVATRERTAFCQMEGRLFPLQRFMRGRYKAEVLRLVLVTDSCWVMTMEADQVTSGPDAQSSCLHLPSTFT